MINHRNGKPDIWLFHHQAQGGVDSDQICFPMYGIVALYGILNVLSSTNRLCTVTTS